MLRALMTSRRFAPLFWCQFFAAFSDNFLKNALVFLILFKIAEGAASSLITLAGGVFIAPFFFLSGLAGQLADRYDKARAAQKIKLAEIAAAALAAAGFALQSIPLLFVALFLFGALSALFGPIKYGILPDHLRREELPAGNALVESATFLAILLGAVAGGLASRGGGDAFVYSLILLACSFASWGTSLLIPPTGEAAPGLRVDSNIARSTLSLIGYVGADRRLLWGALASSWFWLAGAVTLALLPPLTRHELGGDELAITFFLAVFSIFVAVGSFLASWLAHGRIILLPTAVGAVLLALFSLDLGFAASGAAPGEELKSVGALLSMPLGLRAALDFAGLAVAGGLFIVPCFAAIQTWAGADRRARAIAGVNVLNAAAMVLGALVFALIAGAGVSAAGQFMILGAASLAAAAALALTLPTSAFRDFLSILYRAVFRLEVRGAENLNRAGPRRIVALNHVSFLDAGLALSLLDVDPVFAIDSGIAERWWVKPFLKLTRAMPLNPLKPLATRTLIKAVRDGETLVIFPEGRLTVTGSLMKVYDGAGLIADKSEAMVVPVHIDGLEATPFSYLTRAQVRRRWFPKVVVTVLEPVRLQIDPALKGRRRRQAAGAALYDVMSGLVYRTADVDRTIFAAVAAAGAREGLGRIALEDPVSGALTYRRLLAGAHALGRAFMSVSREGECVGLMLPSANGAALAFLALQSAGRVPAMLNFTAGAANIRSACKAAQVSTLATSRAFVEKGRLAPLVEELRESLAIVYLEDMRENIGALDRLRALLGAGKPLSARKPDDLAVVLFTSGTEGAPKGVALSSRNILVNAAQAAARIDFGREDTLFNVLPLFHSFGLTAGLILPLVSGVRVYLYPSPLHYRTIPELVYNSNATILFGTDTFLAGYARAAHPYDFRSLRYVLAGAEPLKAATRETFMEKFGVRILEGYGVTETAPVLALNTPMFTRFGSVGRLLPGIEARLEPVPGVAEGGRLYVRGPNVMLGYLRAEKPGVVEPPAEGWHDTGDIVAIDAEGFVFIKGRAKRFAKIGGEMISLAAVEALAAELWPDDPSAAATVPDARKGEKLVLVTQRKGAARADFQGFAKSRGAGDLMIPAQVLVVEKLPLLGSGKVDYRALNELVAGGETPAEAATA
ncbi:acyl-[ACP]--phospholipid O-acyltransferase [Methylocella sp.]|uniref:acyl-[ACP]--phospholipid O-acyltransferase n=1 Tax=Methylocella sp. TaxID=1978226 RepID=UPI003782DFCD